MASARLRGSACGTELPHRQEVLSQDRASADFQIASRSPLKNLETRTSDSVLFGIFRFFFTRMGPTIRGFLFLGSFLPIRDFAEMVLLQSFSCWPAESGTLGPG